VTAAAPRVPLGLDVPGEDGQLRPQCCGHPLEEARLAGAGAAQQIEGQDLAPPELLPHRRRRPLVGGVLTDVQRRHGRPPHSPHDLDRREIELARDEITTHQAAPTGSTTSAAPARRLAQSASK
jgi:hypothetical protein